MDGRKIDAVFGKDMPTQYTELYQILVEMNEEIERLKKFAKNVNTFGTKIEPSLIEISEDRK